MKRLEICVVGAGIAGLAAALRLHQDGHRVTLLYADPPPEPGDDEIRYYALSPASRSLLEAVGAQAGLEGACPYTAMAVWGDAQRDALRFDVGDAPFGLDALGWITGERRVLHALWQRAAAALTMREGSATAAERHAGTMEVECGDGGMLTADLVIAADGRNSALRERAGIGMAQWDYRQQGIVANVRVEAPLQATAWQRFLPTGPLALLPLDAHTASIVWSADDDLAQGLLAMDDAAFGEALAEAVQQHFGAAEVLSRRAAFPLQVHHAERYCTDGLALLGDAAHVVHPLAGQGLNLGLGDAAELAAQLRAHPRDLPRALRAYSRRRRTAAADMIAVTDGLYRLFGPAGPDFGELRNAGMALVNHLSPARGWLVQKALGLGEPDRRAGGTSQPVNARATDGPGRVT